MNVFTVVVTVRAILLALCIWFGFLQAVRERAADRRAERRRQAEVFQGRVEKELTTTLPLPEEVKKTPPPRPYDPANPTAPVERVSPFSSSSDSGWDSPSSND